MALEPQDCALWLNLPLAAVLALLLSRPEAVGGAAGTGAGEDGGGRDSTGAVAPLQAAAEVTETSAGAGEDEVVGAGWADTAAVDGGVSNRAIFAWDVGVPKLPSS